MPGLLCFFAWRKAQQCLRASIPSLPVKLHSAALYCYYFGYPLLPKGANRGSTKIEMPNWKLSKHGTGSMEGQGKVQTDGFVSQPPTLSLLCPNWESALMTECTKFTQSPSGTACDKGFRSSSCAFLVPCQVCQGVACHHHDFAELLTSTGFEAFTWHLKNLKTWSAHRNQQCLQPILDSLKCWASLGARLWCVEGSELTVLPFN